MNISIDDLDWKSILVKKYKEYGLDEKKTMILFLSDSILKIEPHTFLTPETLSSYMTLDKDEIDSSLSYLVTKGFLEVKSEGGELFSSLDSFKKRLFEDVVKEFVLKNSTRTVSDDSNFYTEIENISQSVLSPFDKDRITSWLRNGASEGMIKEAIEKSLTSNGNINFSKADKMIQEMKRGKSREELGASTEDDANSSQAIRDFLANNDWTYHGDK